MRQPDRPYRIIGVYDSETSNITDGMRYRAFPCLHQLGIISDSVNLVDITPDNVEDLVSISMYRHALDLYAELDAIIASEREYVPVICCHNLSFDMYGLSPWLDGKDVRCLAKSRRKPISFTIMQDGSKRLVIWDTLVFSGQPLARMGFDCGYEKAVGEWDYEKVRTPITELTTDEVDYAKKDVYALFVWLGWWLRNNPDIEPEKLGFNVVTKTGVVRERRKRRFNGIKGSDCKNTVGSYWLYRNRTQSPKSDDELFTMMACTRGGLTFCAENAAGVPYDMAGIGNTVIGYDATSQHPAQMVSHKYPIDFHKSTPDHLQRVFKLVSETGMETLLQRFVNPFDFAFNARFRFTNIRPKKNSIYEAFGILPLASARFSRDAEYMTDDNEQTREFADNMGECGYKDTCINGRFSFGKLTSADIADVFLTELAAWEVSRCYDFDSVEAVGGYLSTRFVRPTDLALISVMQFYKAKNEFKAARGEYYKTHTISNAAELARLGVAVPIIDAMLNGECSETDVEATYLSLKADLNALFGIEACNEFRRDTVMTEYGIDFDGEFGICNAPRNPKAWYQFGQRIVGWSRIAQLIIMESISPYVRTIINGDTDSIKVLASEERKQYIDSALKSYAKAIDAAHAEVCNRIETAYPDLYDPLDGIGHYVREFETDRFCAGWNKAYVHMDGERPRFTLAGIPVRFGIEDAARQFMDEGKGFDWMASNLLGYNVCFSHSVTRMNGRSFPEWGSAFVEDVTDWRGDSSPVREPAALALFPMEKIVNDTTVPENRSNYRIASRNNPAINSDRVILMNAGGRYELVDTGL